MSHVQLVRLIFVYVLLVGVFLAQTLRANVCDGAAFRAAEATGVPVDVLLTITRLETGRASEGNAPWPWTVNHSGDGTWFPSEDDARSYVFSKVKRGSSNIDIGCFQINYRWHADAFRSLDDMFNPDQNARYAAEFLQRLHEEFGDWTTAVGAYHSRTPEFAEKYKAKFRAIRPSVEGMEATQIATVSTRSPSEQQGQTISAGSLFLAEATGATPFITFGGGN